MQVLLVSPRQSMSLHTFTEVGDLTGRPGVMPNLALPTLAALAPPDVEVTAVDESVAPIDFDAPWDVVGVTGYQNHRKRMFEIADEFRRRGRLVAIGGPYASLSPAIVRPHADVLFVGEAEETWPRFLADLKAGRWEAEYRQPGNVDLARSPMPRIGDMPRDVFYFGAVQTSRGCPFECEFCDVIVYLGRRQRHKAPERIVAELEQLYRAGFRDVLLADDNFTANRKRAAEILTALRDWQGTKEEPVMFVTQLSVDCARDQELLALCAAAGLGFAFIGIETPDPEALKSVKKKQNVRPDLVGDLHQFYRQGIGVVAGMITGFDTDTRETFEAQYRFAQTAGTPIVTAGMLAAPEGTAIEERMIKEGRLVGWQTDDVYLETNIIPKNMTREELAIGTRWLLNKLYTPRSFLERIAVFTRELPPRPRAGAADREGLKRTAAAWKLFHDAYASMGPEFSTVPGRLAMLFNGRGAKPLVALLLWYKHIVTVLKKWEVWDPATAALPAPDFDGRGAMRMPG